MKVIIIKKDDGSNDEISCEACIFHDACMETHELPHPIRDCKPGEYWKHEEENKVD